MTRLVMKDSRDPRRVKLERAILEYQEEQVATMARKGRKRSRTQMPDPESTRLEEQARWQTLVDVSARQDI